MSGFFTQEKIEIRSLEDILNRPHYQASVRPLNSEFRYVLASYSFPRKIACCAVTNCYLNHKKGYLVRTRDGGDCSICQSCAEHFFEPSAIKPPKANRRPARLAGTAVSRRQPTAAQATHTKMTVESYLQVSGKIKQRVQDLKQLPQGANWLYRALSSFQKTAPAELFSALKELRLDGDESPVFERLIETNASDLQLENVEQLEGLGVFDADIRELLIERILQPLGRLDVLANKVGGGGSIGVPLNWEREVEQNLKKSEQILAEAKSFFTQQNFERLKSIPLSAKAAQAVRTLRWDEKNGIVTKL